MSEPKLQGKSHDSQKEKGSGENGWNAVTDVREHGCVVSGNGCPACLRTGSCATRPGNWMARAG